ncbi:hypothetical protein ACPSL3_10190 [Vibrio owensii]|uniref:hypothetical protein n=1 Tax=Vibrio owensii TaxID=696485 RepID=UPI003CE47B24
MKFQAGDETNLLLVKAIYHEFCRCQDAFEQFMRVSNVMILKGHTPEVAYFAYNSYTSFLHHLYEMSIALRHRELGDTSPSLKGTKFKKQHERHDAYFNGLAQRIMDRYAHNIKKGIAPVWVNDLSYYEVSVPDDFGKDFRHIRNKTLAHVDPRRVRDYDLTEFYSKYHKFVYEIYRDQLEIYGRQKRTYDFEQVTKFSVALSR